MVGMNPQVLSELKSQARRRGVSLEEVEDLVQDSVLAGLSAGRSDGPYLQGILRNQLAMRRRSDHRRRLREQQAIAGQMFVSAPPSDPLPVRVLHGWLISLSPASRRLATLVLAGMTAEEIRWLLGLSAAAFRQRVASLRAAVRRCPPELRACLREIQPKPAWPAAPRRCLLKRALPANALSLATHDVDGHVLVVGKVAHVSGFRGNR